MSYLLKTRTTKAGLVFCLIATHSFASEEAQLIVYELSNPLLEQGAPAPSVKVSMSGHVTIFRPAGFKKPGRHEYVVSDVALASLIEDMALLDTAQFTTGALLDATINQREPSAISDDGTTRTLHDTDETTVSISVPQIDLQLLRQPETLSRVGSLPMTTIQMTQADLLQPATGLQVSASSVDTLSRDMHYLYRLPLTSVENSTEVEFDD